MDNCIELLNMVGFFGLLPMIVILGFYKVYKDSKKGDRDD